VQLEDGNNIVLTRTARSPFSATMARELEAHNLVIGSVISIQNGERVKKGDAFVQWDPYNVPILFGEAGRVKIPRHHRRCHHEAGSGRNHEPGSHGHHRAQGRFASAIVITVEKVRTALRNYPIPSGAHIASIRATKLSPEL